MSTKDNLKNAFEGESWANRKYLAFAKKANEDSHTQVARLFRAMAESEAVHAKNHLKILGDVLSTKENITYARDLEAHVSTEMYPQMIEEAKKEGNSQAAQSFEFTKEVEKGHVTLCQKALDNLGKNEIIDYYICQNCGDIAEASTPDTCPVCKAPQTEFMKIS